MNEKQHKFYLWHWGRVAKKLRSLGKTSKEIEAERKRAHFAIGACFFNYGKLTIKSSLNLNNRDFDLFIARCESIVNARDLQAQLDQLEMPKTRALYATAQLLDDLGLPKDEDHRAKYLEGIVKKPLEETDDEDLQRLVVACNHNRLHKQGIEHNHPRTGKGPQSRHAHRVGYKSKVDTTPRIQTKDTPKKTQYTMPFSDYGKPF